MGTIKLEIPSDRQIVDLAEMGGVGVARIHGMADGETEALGLAVRETVINAIVHGNKEDRTQRVSIEFAVAAEGVPRRLVTTVRDQGQGFDLEEVPDPLAPENLLRRSGRGLLFICGFTDDLSVTRVPTGGTEVRFTKQIARHPAVLSAHHKCRSGSARSRDAWWPGRATVTVRLAVTDHPRNATTPVVADR